jgi:hypothetical protein
VPFGGVGHDIPLPGDACGDTAGLVQDLEQPAPALLVPTGRALSPLPPSQTETDLGRRAVDTDRSDAETRRHP